MGKGGRETAPRGKALAALAEDPGSHPSIHRDSSQPSVVQVPVDPVPSVWLLQAPAHKIMSARTHKIKTRDSLKNNQKPL